MATTRKDASKVQEKSTKPAAQEAKAPQPDADQGVARGGWDVGYRGDRVDETPDEAYTVTGVLKDAQSDK